MISEIALCDVGDSNGQSDDADILPIIVGPTTTRNRELRVVQCQLNTLTPDNQLLTEM